MNYDPSKHHRRSIRLKDYDYTQAGAYFITLCVENRACVLGDVIDGEMQLSPTGVIVAEAWEWLAQQYPYVAIDEYVVMPNHFHGIIVIDAPTVGAVREPPTITPTPPPTVGAVREPPTITPTPPPTVGAVREPPTITPTPPPTVGAVREPPTITPTPPPTVGAVREPPTITPTPPPTVGAVREPPTITPTPPPTVGAVREPPTITPTPPPTVGAVREPPDEPPDEPPNQPHRKPLGRLIGAFKTVSTKRINELNATPGIAFWQRNYYERIIRHENALDRIRRYIIHNPMKWAIDRQNPLSHR